MPSKAEEIIRNSDEIGAYTGLALPLIVRTVERGVGALTEAERQFVAVYQLHTNVNNGGFYGYFTNTSGDFATDALNGLERIGALHIYSLLAKARSVFPDGSVPRTQAERETFLQDRPSDKWADLDKPNRFKRVLEPLDKEFYASPDRLSKLAVEFAREHIKDFNIT